MPTSLTSPNWRNRGPQLLGQFMTTLWRASAPLTGLSLLMLVLLVACVFGLWLDPRSIAGAPAWLKPAKFAASVALYCLTLSWVFLHLPGRMRLRSWVGWSTASLFFLELAVICVQAWRGKISHFNTSTLLDGTLFTIMGIGILLQTLASVVVAVALWRQAFADRALGWSLRLGLCIAIAGASLGGLMTRPTPEQLDAMRLGPPSVVGAHTVGAADGGPGLPGTGWSREHGDLRVPHFLGLHALQALPLLALGLGRRRWSEQQRTRLVLSSAACYVSLVGLLLWQALRGQPLLEPDGPTVAAALTWLGLAFVLARQAVRGERRAAAYAS